MSRIPHLLLKGEEPTSGEDVAVLRHLGFWIESLDHIAKTSYDIPSLVSGIRDISYKENAYYWRQGRCLIESDTGSRLIVITLANNNKIDILNRIFYSCNLGSGGIMWDCILSFDSTINLHFSVAELEQVIIPSVTTGSGVNFFKNKLLTLQQEICIMSVGRIFSAQNWSGNLDIELHSALAESDEYGNNLQQIMETLKVHHKTSYDEVIKRAYKNAHRNDFEEFFKDQTKSQNINSQSLTKKLASVLQQMNTTWDNGDAMLVESRKFAFTQVYRTKYCHFCDDRLMDREFKTPLPEHIQRIGAELQKYGVDLRALHKDVLNSDLHFYFAQEKYSNKAQYERKLAGWEFLKAAQELHVAKSEPMAAAAAVQTPEELIERLAQSALEEASVGVVAHSSLMSYEASNGSDVHDEVPMQGCSGVSGYNPCIIN